MAENKFKRIILKLSGEAMAGSKGFGIDPETVMSLAKQIKEVVDQGLEVGIVNGGGNIWRGLSGSRKGMNRATADYMGMLATVMNCIYVSEIFRSVGMGTETFTPFQCAAFRLLLVPPWCRSFWLIFRGFCVRFRKMTR